MILSVYVQRLTTHHLHSDQSAKPWKTFCPSSAGCIVSLDLGEDLFHPLSSRCPASGHTSKTAASSGWSNHLVQMELVPPLILGVYLKVVGGASSWTSTWAIRMFLTSVKHWESPVVIFMVSSLWSADFDLLMRSESGTKYWSMWSQSLKNRKSLQLGRKEEFEVLIYIFREKADLLKMFSFWCSREPQRTQGDAQEDCIHYIIVY